MRVDEALGRLDIYSHAVLVLKDDKSRPLNVATQFHVEDSRVLVDSVQTGLGEVPSQVSAHLIFSRIHPIPGYGYDERSYIDLEGTLQTDGDRWQFSPSHARGWDEGQVPFFELCERALPQARRYLDRLQRERGEAIKPRMALGWKFFVATRLPFLTATLVPVFLGIAVAAYERHFSLPLMLLTLLGAISVHLGLNVANDVFDAQSGADEANVNPTMFSGGSRAIQYGLITLRQMAALSGIFYVIAIVCGLILMLISGLGLFWIGLAGILISIFYTAPPLRLVHRGLGEPAVALGFGPIMVLGAYYVQTGHYAWRPAILSIPVAVFVMLILYANEIPDRIADASVGKRTLVVRFSPRVVIGGYLAAAAVAYITVVVATIAGAVPWPTLLALLTIPLALWTARGLQRYFDRPYDVMSALQNNIVLHLTTGILLIVGVLVGKAVA